MTKAKAETKPEFVRLPIRVETGKQAYAPGENVPITKDFTEEDAARIISIHGEYQGKDEPVRPVEAKTDAKISAKDDEIAKLRAVIAAYETVDEAAVKAGAEDASDADKKALDDALAGVTAARKAAKL